jgi:hypothetical protein
MPMILLTKKSKTRENLVNHYISVKLFIYIFCAFLFLSEITLADIIPSNNLLTKRGATSTAPLEVLNSNDQSGNNDDPTKYLEFKPVDARYSGLFRINIPSNLRTNLNSLILHANYRGPARSTQKWAFRIQNFSTGLWVPITDNGIASAWTWTTLKKTISGSPNSYLNNNGQINIAYSTMGTEDSQLDFLAIETVPKNITTTAPPPTVTTPATTSPSSVQNTRWQPEIGIDWQVQYSGAINTSLYVQAYDLDLFDTDAAVIDKLHASGKRVICYFSAGSYENWRSDASKFPASALGRNLDGWPGERWLDVRQLTTLVPIMKARMQLAVSKNCDAVDPDNMDSYSNSTGFPLAYNDQLAYNKTLATEAHKLGLAISLKNDLEQIKDLVDYFDFAINESCFQYNECTMLTPFVKAGKPVLGLEYDLSPTNFCPQANALNFDFLKKNLFLDAARIACR